MNFQFSSELVFTVIIQVVTVVTIFVSMRERIKGLEVDMIEVNKELKDARSKHETIAKMDAKLDLLLDRFIPKQG